MNVQDLLDEATERFPALIEDLDNMELLDSDRDILYNLELYNIISRERIIEMFKGNKLPFTDCIEEVIPKEISKDMYHIKEKNCYVKSLSGTNLNLIKDYYDDDNKKVPDVYFTQYDVKIFYVTPLNFKILRSKNSSLEKLYDPIILCKRIIYDAIDKGASDIHFTNNMTADSSYEFKLFYRLLNDYEYVPSFKLDKELNDNLIQTVVSDKTMGQVEDLLSSHGVKTSWLSPLYDGSCDLRVTCSNTRGGYTCVMRISKMGVVAKEITSLGFDNTTCELLFDLAERESGLTVITGPIRSGKNTTMVGITNVIMNKPIKIAELSSPIETIMPFEQHDYQASREVLMNYVNLIKKQDTNVVILNELPDKLVAGSVLDLVNSSLEVLTTFHINRIWHLPYKLEDYFDAHYKSLITQINGVVNQRMFVELCPECKHEAMHRNFSKKVLEMMDTYGIKSFYEANGCLSCNGTGRAKKVQPYAEILIFTDELKYKLLRCKEVWDMEDVIKKEVMDKELSLEFKLRDAIIDGTLSPQDFVKLN